ncbi:MAG: hypothetical protein ACLFS3_00965 [Candidatus Aenigmatarchaeota archaeon]
MSEEFEIHREGEKLATVRLSQGKMVIEPEDLMAVIHLAKKAKLFFPFLKNLNSSETEIVVKKGGFRLKLN